MAEYLRQQNKMKIDSDQFPILCSRCLGPNKNIKMTRSVLGKECKMCHRVFTSYKWRRSSESTTVLVTNVCNICSQLRNLCQCCLLDLEYGLPGYVRDSVKAVEGQKRENRELSEQTALYYAEQGERMITEGGRNKHLIRHQLAASSGSIESSLKQNAFDIRGTTKRKEFTTAVRPPIDETITTIYVGGVKHSGVERVSVHDLKKHFSPYGLVKEIKMIPKKKCALVTFALRDDAEICMESLYNRLKIHNRPLKLMWARPKKKKQPKTKGGQRKSKKKAEAIPQQFKLPSQPPGPGSNMKFDFGKMLENVDDGDLEKPKYILPPALFNLPAPPGDDDDFVYPSTVPLSK